MIALLLFLVGCDKTPAVECVDAGDCDELSVCTEAGMCRAVQCMSSDDCALGSHCDLDANACFTGCERDTDCGVGQTCDTATTQCMPGECADPVVDCYPGEACTDGTCARPEGMCDDCTGTAAYNECLALGGSCRYLSGGYFCLTACDPASTTAGPRDFVCEDLAYNPTNDPNLAIWRWWGDCDRALEAPSAED